MNGKTCITGENGGEVLRLSGAYRSMITAYMSLAGRYDEIVTHFILGVNNLENE
jgi:hypothetical protein